MKGRASVSPMLASHMSCLLTSHFHLTLNCSFLTALSCTISQSSRTRLSSTQFLKSTFHLVFCGGECIVYKRWFFVLCKQSSFVLQSSLPQHTPKVVSAREVVSNGFDLAQVQHLPQETILQRCLPSPYSCWLERSFVPLAQTSSSQSPRNLSRP